MTDRKDPEYEVGYRRPPVASRFKPGQSGNPKGRRKSSKNFLTLVNQELDQPIAVIERGKSRHITKREAIAKQLVNKSVAADLRSLRILLDLFKEPAEPTPGESSALSEDDRKTLESLVAQARARARAGGGDDGES